MNTSRAKPHLTAAPRHLPPVPTLVLGGLVALGSLGLTGCRDGNSGSGHAAVAIDTLVLVVDRTGVAQTDTWPGEVEAQAATAARRAIDEGADTIRLVGIGSDTDAAAASPPLDVVIDGNTDTKRERQRQFYAVAAGGLAHQLAAAPVTTDGTDVVAALRQAAALCRRPEVEGCAVVVVSDLEDGRVTSARSVDAAVTAVAPLMPDLHGIRVEVGGLGASGADSAAVRKVEQAWTELFEQAGAVDVRIARTL